MAEHPLGQRPFHAVAVEGEALAGTLETTGAAAGWQVARPQLPQRYRLRKGDRGSHVVCDEAPRVVAHVRRDFSFSESEARELGGRVILLDGAGSFGPLLDNKRRLYNLDHHQGCERTFTLATCEQALLLVGSGLDLSEGDWTLYANEPDLDTVLALWCLLNHARLRQLRPESRDVLLPMLRLEGAIDANGSELAEFCGLPAEVLREAQQRLDHLLEREQKVKAAGQWQTIDFEQYVVDMLGEIDRLIYSVEDFRGYASIEEVYGHTEIAERCVAVVCRDGAGIYAVEKLLKERWGDQLGVIALEKERGHYTLRRAAALSDIDLNDAYEVLNLLDRNVDGRPPGKRWGGSGPIGGSPRPTGSALSPSELLRVLGMAFRQPTRAQKLVATWRIALLAGAIAAFGMVAGLGGAAIPEITATLGEETALALTFSLFIGVASWILTPLHSERRPWLYGWRRPATIGWLPFALLGALAAVPARAWFPRPLSLELDAVAASAATVVVSALAVESLFRGLVHGRLRIEARLGREFAGISGAVWVSAALYAVIALALSAPDIWFATSPLLTRTQEVAVVLGAAMIGGLALGAVREQSLSVWPCVAAQIAGGAGCAAFWFWITA